MRIEIVFINGVSKIFLFDNNDLIKQLKKNSWIRIDELSNIDNAVCVLKYKGLDLEDDLSLFDYDVNDGDRIHF